MPAREMKPPAPYEILYEDNHLLVVSKSPGVLCQSDRHNSESLLELLQEHIRREKDKPGNVFLGLVHRLDRNTGGVVVYAKTSKAAARLSEQFREHTAKKVYLAALERRPEPAEGTMEDHLIKDERLKKAFLRPESTPGAKLARLTYRTIGECGRSSRRPPLVLVQIELLTGRFHQIRAQFASRGMPLAGDTKYGSTLRLGGPALWAVALDFEHPTQKTNLHFESRPPAHWPFHSRDETG